MDLRANLSEAVTLSPLERKLIPTGIFIELPEGVEMVQPGDHATFTVELIQPIAMEEGLTFAVREGGHTVGSGRVTKILA